MSAQPVRAACRRWQDFSGDADTGATLIAMATSGKKTAKKDPYDTPAMRQFTRFKKEHPGCVLFFRMGDFYEMFGDDAIEMSRVLGLTLSERPKGVPLAGAPHHQLHNYLKRAVDAGYRVAIADQVQDPKDAKGIVERAVTRVVTAGTLVDEGLVGEEAAAIAAVIPLSAKDRRGGTGSGAPGAWSGDGWAGAAVDLSTGRFVLFDCGADGLGEHLARLAVREVVYPEGVVDEASLDASLDETPVALSPRSAWQFRADEAQQVLCSHYGVRTLEGFGVRDDDSSLPAAGGLVAYLAETQSVSDEVVKGERWAASGGEFQGQRRTLAHLRPPTREEESSVCRLDAVSLRALEVVRTIRADAGRTDGGRAEGGKHEAAGSLLGVFTGTPGLLATPMGKRLIREWLCRPLSEAARIHARQSAVAALVEDRTAADALADALRVFPDLARIAGRVSLGRATPRDLVSLADGVGRLPAVVDAIDATPAFAGVLERVRGVATELGSLGEAIRASCVDEAPATLAKGGLIRDGVDPALDEARLLQRDAGAWLAEYQSKLIADHELPSLKVGYNRVFGYYIELPSAQARRAPDSFTRKQTLTNAERYITPELKTFEDKVTTAEDRALERERELFAALLARSAGVVREIGVYADAIAEIDVLAGLAGKAYRRAWVRPEVSDQSILDIRGGRHPVLDELLGDRFVPNDLALRTPGSGHDASSGAGLALITGPNMAGKSTYIRQTALLVLLASIGSYVPAESAVIGTCDRIFTRVGADDALHRGRSTFMVEMTETAAILNNCSPRSLVILDEIGRGTSTLDGLSLAWAITEQLSGTASAPGPRTLFATHYHELTELAEQRPGRVGNLHVQVREWTNKDGESEIVFVHRIGPGRADRSYGVHVARLAGVPESVTTRAEQVLASLSVQGGTHGTVLKAPPGTTANAEPRGSEQTDAERVAPERPRGEDCPDQLSLFGGFAPHPAVDRLRELKLESLSPMQAFDVLRELVDEIHASE